MSFFFLFESACCASFLLALLFLYRLSPTLTTAVNNQCHHNSMLITFSSLSRIASYMRFPSGCPRLTESLRAPSISITPLRELSALEKQVPNKLLHQTVVFKPYNSRARKINYEFRGSCEQFVNTGCRYHVTADWTRLAFSLFIQHYVMTKFCYL